MSIVIRYMNEMYMRQLWKVTKVAAVITTEVVAAAEETGVFGNLISIH
ncbi:hypothetical protein [Bacillus sp. 1P06AnD]